ncbi:MAG: hypothetical protein J1F09_05895 [Oscillospiraceae bacterium]|nr:hypothetical protein [Oscillospiraceae bacterium]
MINTVSANSHKFQRHIRTISKSDEGFSSAVSKQLEKNCDLTVMHVGSRQSTLEEWLSDLDSIAQTWGKKEYMQVPVTGDLKELMESIEKALADGETLQNALQNRIDKYVKEGKVYGSCQTDLLLIDPDTGEVIDSLPKSRCIVFKNLQDLDRSTVKSQADDLATFLRYTVFKKETDDPEKVEALIAELKAKQSDYDTSRFLPIFSSAGEQGLKNAKYLIHLLGLDKVKWDSLSEEERDKLSDQLTDELMIILGEHYSSDDNKNDDLLEEMKKMKSANVGIAKIQRRVLSEL